MTGVALTLEGSILVDEQALSQAAEDFGHLVHQQPRALIRPQSVADVQAAIRYARQHGMFVAARGRGHGTFGQAQARAGLVLDMSSLSRIVEFDRESAWIEGGCSWGDLVDRTAPEGLAPPTLTDYLGLSVGGTLSVGGVGGASFRHGLQTDNVLELEVVTGTGDLVRCSESQHSELFDAIRAGLGQCGIIVGARVRLVAMPERIEITQVHFDDFQSLLSTHLELAKSGPFDYLDGTIMANGSGGHQCVLTLAIGAGAPHELPTKGVVNVEKRECSYHEFAHRVQDYVTHLVQMGVWDGPHPWLDLFLPASRVAEFVRTAVGELATVRDGMILTYAVCRASSRTPLSALPGEEWSFLVDLLRNTPIDRVDRDLARNVELCQIGASLGAGVYPIGAMPGLDWPKLFPGWSRLATAKQQFDPDGVMTPGQGPAR